MANLDLTGLDPAAVLAALYNAAAPAGWGFKQYRPVPMTVEEARVELSRHATTDPQLTRRFPGAYAEFDYLNGRYLKFVIRGNQLDTYRYEERAGDGAAVALVAALRSGPDVVQRAISTVHQSALQFAIDDARKELDQPQEAQPQDDHSKTLVVQTSLTDRTGELRAAIDRAEREITGAG